MTKDSFWDRFWHEKMFIELHPSSTGEDSSSTSARRLQSEKARRKATGSNSSSPLVVRAKHASDIVYRQPSDCSSRGWKYEKVMNNRVSHLLTDLGELGLLV